MYRPETGMNHWGTCDVIVKDDIIGESGKECLVKCVAGNAFRGLDYIRSYYMNLFALHVVL